MKKFSLILASLIGLIIFLGGCEKEITTTALDVDTTKTAALKVYLRADLDTTVENVAIPDGTTINASVKKNDLNPQFIGQDRVLMSATSSSGVVEFEVPTTNEGVTVYEDGATFEYDYLVNDTITEKRKFELLDRSYFVKNGGSYVEYEVFDYTVLETINN